MEETSIRPPAELSEAEYLDQEVELARRAMSHALTDLKHDAREMVDPRNWIRRYPLASSMAACAIGALVAPGRRRRTRRRRTREREGHVTEAVEKAGGWAAPIARELGGALRRVVLSAVTSGLVARGVGSFQQAGDGSLRDGAEQPTAAAEAEVGGQI
jgi:hypothetical protein